MSDWINFDALWKIIVVGLLAGAGLPAVFAIGLRLLSLPGGGTPETVPAGDTRFAGDDRIYGGNPAAAAGAEVCFAIVLAAVGWGIYTIVSS